MSEASYHFDVTVDNFDQYVLENSRQVPVLVDFWAPWCGPCQSLMPLLGRLAEQYGGQFLLAKVNIDEQQELATRFGIRSVPTVKLLRHGEVVDEFAGALPEPQIRQFLDPHIERESDRRLPAIQAAFEAGEQEQALQQLLELRELEPDNHRLVLVQAEMLMAANRPEEAGRLLDALPANMAQEADVQALQSRLKLMAAVKDAPAVEVLRQRIEADPADSEARYQLAHQLTASGDYEAALEAFLGLLQRDRQFADDGARKGILMVFELLGNQGELVSRYRRKMAMAMH
jgi:putative thioredoxin